MFAGEVLVVDFFEAGLLDMGVDLGGGDAGMAQHGLDGPQIRAMVQQVGGEGMAKHMGEYALGDARSNGTGL